VVLDPGKSMPAPPIQDDEAAEPGSEGNSEEMLFTAAEPELATAPADPGLSSQESAIGRSLEVNDSTANGAPSGDHQPGLGHPVSSDEVGVDGDDTSNTTKTTRSPAPNTSQRSKPKGSSPVLRSFLSPDSDGESSLSEQEKQRRRDTDSAGVQHVMDYERRAGRIPVEMPHENEGYDIESFDTSGELVRYIEVKSLSGAWDGYNVKVTPAQFRRAQRELHEFWLYVVEHAGSDERQLRRIQNPAGSITEFRFDDGWTCVEEISPIRTEDNDGSSRSAVALSTAGPTVTPEKQDDLRE